MDRELQADLQACHAAYDVIDETAVYTCTGNPQPKDIERVVQSMMSDEFGTSYSRTCFATPLSSSSSAIFFWARDGPRREWQEASEQ